MDIEKAKRMYENDSGFHRIVQMMKAAMHQMELTPSEVRGAAMLAAIQFENEHIRPRYITDSGVDLPKTR